MMSWHTLSIDTPCRTAFVDITGRIQEIVSDSAISEGLVYIHCPHTTAGLTLNENADPDVQHDLKLVFDRIAPQLPSFRHGEGNSDAHAKASLMGFSLTLPVQDSTLALGRWQAVYFCEFDGPRLRTVKVRVVS